MTQRKIAWIAWLCGLIPAFVLFSFKMANFGIPSVWPYWVFPMIAIAPVTLRALLLTALDYAILDVKVINPGGDLRMGTMIKTIQVWRWSKKGKEHLAEKRNKKKPQ